jgi:hypothetical protein
MIDEVDFVSPATLHHSLFDKEGERDFSVAGRHVIFEIERRHELAEHRGLADRLQAAAAGRDEGSFLDQIEHVAGAAGRAIPVLLVERPGVAIDEPTPKLHLPATAVAPSSSRTPDEPRLSRPAVLRSRHELPPLCGVGQVAGIILPLLFKSNFACLVRGCWGGQSVRCLCI